MNTLLDPQTFDQKLRELTGEAPLVRPFLCEGSPFECEIFLVGINPGKSSGFWPHWNALRGCDKRGWLQDYLAEHGRYSPTRERIERLFKALGPLRCLETNIYTFPSRRESDLDAAHRDTRVFDFLLKTIRPRLLFVHGNSAVQHLARLTKSDLSRGQFTAVSYCGVAFDVFAGHHLSYQW